MRFIKQTYYHFAYLASLFLLISYSYALPNIALTNCNIIDGRGAPIASDMVVIISDNKIKKIDRGPYKNTIEKDMKIIDLKGGYVLPGFWNNHSHLSDLLPDVNNILGSENTVSATIRAGRNAMDALKRGFTSLRSTGSRDYLDVYWGKAFEDGVFIGPTIYSAGNPLAAEDGHGIDDYAWPATIPVNGKNEMKQAVRRHLDMGVSWIKIMADELTEEEISTAVSIAHKSNVKVVAHAAEEGAYRAIKAGVDCIEHGYDLSEKTLKLMVKRGVFYDPTIVCNLSAEYITEREDKITEIGLENDQTVIDGRILVAYADERSPARALRQRKILLRAQEIGVKITAGADSNPLGELGLLEIEQLAFSGLTEMQAIIAATKNSAEMNGVLDKVGTIEEGKIADLIVLSDNPLDHISNIRKLEMVIKNGHIIDISFPEKQSSFWNLYFKDKKEGRR
jgi:imidazolonepropionase-like amidohydrolase